MELNVSEEELQRLLNKASTDTKIIADGRSGLSIANEALATILIHNFKATRSLVESSKKMEWLTIVLGVLTVVLIIITIPDFLRILRS